MMVNDFQLRDGVVGGTLFSTMFNFGVYDVLGTALMALIGAAVSFFVSYFLRKWFSDRSTD